MTKLNPIQKPIERKIGVLVTLTVLFAAACSHNRVRPDFTPAPPSSTTPTASAPFSQPTPDVEMPSAQEPKKHQAHSWRRKRRVTRIVRNTLHYKQPSTQAAARVQARVEPPANNTLPPPPPAPSVVDLKLNVPGPMPATESNNSGGSRFVYGLLLVAAAAAGMILYARRRARPTARSLRFNG